MLLINGAESWLLRRNNCNSSFVSYSNFGILNGLNRELPIAKGLRSKKAEHEIYNAVSAFF